MEFKYDVCFLPKSPESGLVKNKANGWRHYHTGLQLFCDLGGDREARYSLSSQGKARPSCQNLNDLPMICKQSLEVEATARSMREHRWLQDEGVVSGSELGQGSLREVQ